MRPPSGDAGRMYDGVMTHLDLTPTFLDLAGAEPLPGMEGRSFAEVLRGEAHRHRDAVVVERISILAEGAMKVKMLVTEDWKLLHYGSAPYGELYDVRNDPEDVQNLWEVPEYAGVKRQLTERLLAALIDDELGDPALILPAREPGGSLRDRRLMEPQPEARADLGDRLRGILEG